ncbi:MAG: glycosyltransferase family 2 protein [Desulfomonilaceae bacterium]
MTYLAFAIATAVLLFEGYFWTMRIRDAINVLHRVPTPNPNKSLPILADPPLISVIVPAHNEQSTIRECLESVLNQNYPQFELILVDDRSDDLTASIARSLSSERKNFRVISVETLPAGWTGKCHALDVGVGYASGEWLAFLDADSCLHESAMRLCYQEAVRRRANMVTFSPRFVVKTFWEKALQPVFAAMTCILYPLGSVNDPASPVASANGMFYMISRSAYKKIGGHSEVRDLAVEDIGIGKRIKAAGLGLVFANGKNVLQTRMYTTFGAIVRGWTRILSASMNYEMPVVLKYLAVHILMSFPVMAASFYIYFCTAREIWPATWFLLPAICSIEMCLVSSWFCAQMGVPRKYSVLLIVGNLMLIWVYMIILKKILWKDALQWRGTTYHTNRYEPTSLDPEASKIFSAPAGTVMGKASWSEETAMYSRVGDSRG